MHSKTLFILTSFLFISTNCQSSSRYTSQNLINTTFYLGRSYEPAYDKSYWTICRVKYFNTTTANITRVFLETSYTFFDNEWAGSATNSLTFDLNPVSYRADSEKLHRLRGEPEAEGQHHLEHPQVVLVLPRHPAVLPCQIR